MSERRAARAPGGMTPSLPAHLSWRSADDPRWWRSDVAPHGLERFRAHQRHHAARRAFLARMTSRPSGVGEWEFQQAQRKDET